MDKKQAIKAVLNFGKELEKKGCSIQKIILFGSYSNGSQHEGSDIDVVVISDFFKKMDYWKRIDILSDAIYSVLLPIEAVAFSMQEWETGNSTIYEYAKNGDVVYSNAA